MRFHERHPGLLQIEGGIAVAARRLRHALQRTELRQKLHVDEMAETLNGTYVNEVNVGEIEDNDDNTT